MDKILIVGAKGLAKEILFSFPRYENKFVFYDDINIETSKIYNKFKVIKSEGLLKSAFNNSAFPFVIGVGGAENRESLFYKFLDLQGNPITLISSNSKVGMYDTVILEGSLIMDGTLITNSVRIGRGTLVNKSSIISHDVIIGNFCDISPGSRIMGHVRIGDKVEIGAGAIIIPKIKIGSNVTIGAGSIVVKDVPDDVVVVGNPAKILKQK